MRTRLRQLCLSRLNTIPCYDTAPVDVGPRALIRRFLLGPAGPQLPPSRWADVDVTCQSSADMRNDNNRGLEGVFRWQKRVESLLKLFAPLVY